jgi:REP element-mobilizing transposase RayT
MQNVQHRVLDINKLENRYVNILAFALMPNHFHIKEKNIAKHKKGKYNSKNNTILFDHRGVRPL